MAKKQKQKKARQTRSRRQLAPARFAVDDKVRVKPGTMDPDFSDVALSGWRGTILETRPPTVLIEWDQATLDAMPESYREVCELKDLDDATMWLEESDLEPAESQAPAPTKTRPLRPNRRVDRIRAIFGLTAADPLPLVNQDHLRQYHRHLAVNLKFPFAGEFVSVDDFPEVTVSQVKVTALDDPGKATTTHGLYCRVELDDDEQVVPLDAIRVYHGPHRRALDDYSWWMQQGCQDHAPPSRSWIHPAIWYALAGAVLGAFIGGSWAALDHAATAIQLGGLLLGVVGALAYSVKDVPDLLRGKMMIIGAAIGGALGATLGAFFSALPGALAGGLAGWCFGKAMGSSVRPLWCLFGGAVGVTIQVWLHDASAAWIGAAIGAGIGALGLPVLIRVSNSIIGPMEELLKE